MAQWQDVLDDVVRTRRADLVGHACLFSTRSEAEDLVQEALVRTFARRRSCPDAHAAEAYVRVAYGYRPRVWCASATRCTDRSSAASRSVTSSRRATSATARYAASMRSASRASISCSVHQ